MANGTRDCRSLAPPMLAGLLGGLLALAAPAPAQTKHRMMVFDDGGGPQVVQFTGPDLRELRKPDFVRQDLPIFNEKLDLDEVQRLIVGVLLDSYLDAFKTLAGDVLPTAPNPMLGMAMGEPPGAGGEGQDSESLESIVRGAIDESGGASDMDIDIAAQGPVMIQIEATAAFGEGGEGSGQFDEGATQREIGIVLAEDGEDEDGPRSGVFIAVEGPEGMELPQEVREKLAQKAQEMAERIREQLEQAEEEGNMAARDLNAPAAAEERQQYFDELRESSKKFEKAKTALKQDFINEVRNQLSSGQQELWPGLERALTRIKTLPEGRLDGERTNLLQIVDDFPLDDDQREAVAEALESYELELHEALVARNAFLREAQSKIDKAIEEGRFAGAISTADKASRRRVAVRGVNEQFAETIAGRLGPGPGEAFRDRVLLESYPRVYRTTRGQKTFRTAGRIEGLDDEVRSAIDQLEAAYTAELESANERLREAIHRHQPREARQMLENIRSMMEDGEPMSIGDEDDPVRVEMRRRSQLDERYMKQVYTLLTPQQLERLPKLPSQIKREPIIIQRSSSPE
jgi:hypothetical protein